MRKKTLLLAAGMIALTVAAATAAIAAPAIPAFTTSAAPSGGTAYSLPVQTLLLMTPLTFIPAALLMITSSIPFLIIDMVVASVLMSMGMMMMSPAVISLPFKLMLFVLVDGWQLLLGSLSQSFN